MRFFVLALFLNLCCVLGSPAVRRADTATPTSTLQSSSTTPSAAATSQSFLWSNGQNTSYGGYYPEWDVCPGVGTTCEQACGLGAVKCGSYSDTCYFPRLGDTCCSDTGVSCWAGTTCAYIEVDYDTNYFCCSEEESEEECASLQSTPVEFLTPLPNPTSSYPSSATGLVHPTTVLMTKDHYITVAAPISTSNPSDSAQVFKSSESSSSSSLTVGAKIGVGIGVPVAALALGLLAVFVWFRAVKRRRSRTPEVKPPWEVDAQESQLTPEEYERKKNQKPPEDDEEGANYGAGAEEPAAPQRSSLLQVSPLSRNRDSMAISSVNTTSPSVNYSPIPVSDLPELVDGPSK